LSNQVGYFNQVTEVEALKTEVETLKAKLRKTQIAVCIYGQLQKLLGEEDYVFLAVKELLAEEKFPCYPI
jgi:hypothetical protein